MGDLIVLEKGEEAPSGGSGESVALAKVDNVKVPTGCQMLHALGQCVLPVGDHGQREGDEYPTELRDRKGVYAGKVCGIGLCQPDADSNNSMSSVVDIRWSSIRTR
ncbi:MAG: hypothetical protein EXQ60_06090 [Candidatus Nanopelagicales bacterium]|nr:hypothetical protein [Candidatus Nanopelagicales bacterium]